MMRSGHMVRRTLILSLLVAGMVISGNEALGQRKPRREKQEETQTPANQADRDRENRMQKESEYKMRRDHHDELQDKGTRKRMKKNMKRSQKQSWGKEIPWYKRVFRKRHF